MKILITGAAGQIGSELVKYLGNRYGKKNIFPSDILDKEPQSLAGYGAYEVLDVRNGEKIAQVVDKYNIDTIYHLAAILSATGEANPHLAWDVNMNGSYQILEVAREKGCAVFAPSSIAAFGPSTPRNNTPQETIQRPTSMYGVTKVAGELLMDYYYQRFGVDVRGVRYPGLISYLTPPGGGTTDYAVDIFYQALKEKSYSCFLKSDAKLPMMYMPDALKAAVDLMEADPDQLIHRNAFNVAAFSFTPAELAREIKKIIPDFEMSYEVDQVKQAIADSWPCSLDDSAAQQEWGWKPDYSLEDMVVDMLKNLRKKLNI